MRGKGQKNNMNQLSPGKMPEKPRLPGEPARILVAPLDWGLGHATRCIPLIRELLAQGVEVWLAGEGAQEQLLKEEFPGLPLLQLPGYSVRYAISSRGLIWKMIRQGPKIFRAISTEHKWLKEVVGRYNMDAVISDNRYGLYHTAIPCIFITHQLLVKSTAGKWVEKMLQRRNYKYINRFKECWVPDAAGNDNLAGELSHPVNLPKIPVKYIGHLSRFETKPITEKKEHLLIILSGPEPQRSLLEEIIIREISHYNGTATIIRGLPAGNTLIPSTGMIKFYNHLAVEEMNREMQEAEFVISRSGYSTVMDAMALQKKCIFVPTPGQTEQEYLGQYLIKRGIAYCASQKEFSLTVALNAARQFNYAFPAFTGQKLLPKTVAEFLSQFSGAALG